MRKIKFRAWNEIEEKYNNDTDIIMTLNGDYCVDKGFVKLFPKLILEQYTGLKDKNGKEIYEGDIVKVYAWTNLTRGLEYRYTTKVFWQEKYAQFNTTYNDALSDEITQDYFEIVGNIHENPELLGGEE